MSSRFWPKLSEVNRLRKEIKKLRDELRNLEKEMRVIRSVVDEHCTLRDTLDANNAVHRKEVSRAGSQREINKCWSMSSRS